MSKEKAGHPLPPLNYLVRVAATLAHKENLADPKGNHWRKYLERALQLHLEAELFHEELVRAEASHEMLLETYGSELAWLNHVMYPRDQKENRVHLLLGSKTSPAHIYIGEKHNWWRTSKTILKHIREALGKECAKEYLANNKLFDPETGNHIGYNLDKSVIDRAFKMQKAKKSESSRKSQAKSAKNKKAKSAKPQTRIQKN